MHEAARPQQDSSTRQPCAGSARWCSTPLDSIRSKRASDGAELEDVGLRVFDIVQPKLARLAGGVAEAGQAEVDGEHARAGEALPGFDGVLAGAAAGDQHIEARSRVRRSRDRRLRELIAQIPAERHRPADGRRLHPARIGHLFVLVADLFRNLVVDRGEGRDASTDLLFLQRFAHLLLDERRDRLWPGPCQQASRHDKCMQAAHRPRPQPAVVQRLRRLRSEATARASPAIACTCAVSSSVCAKTYSLMKHCRASAQKKAQSVVISVDGIASNRRLPAMRGVAAVRCASSVDIAHRRRFQERPQEPIAPANGRKAVLASRAACLLLEQVRRQRRQLARPAPAFR